MNNMAVPSSLSQGIVFRDIAISRRSRFIVWIMRLIAKPLMARIVRSNNERMARFQLRLASMPCPNTAGLPLEYDIVGQVPGHVVGTLDDNSRPLVLWLHGGAFILPAAPAAHLVMLAKLCRDLNADGFAPDYRLAPASRFPAPLDDCERAYRTLLDKGYDPSKIVLGGDSAGGNLVLGLLQRIRKAGLPMPACAIPVSPATELGRVHALPSRHRIRKSDPLLPVVALARIDELYVGDWDSSDPELSPLYMECHDLPPMFFTASDNEVLMDDTVLLAKRMLAADAPVTCHVWPTLPHAFPLLESFFPEARQARQDITDFAKAHLGE